ncbi:MAG: phosphoglycerate kinase [Patescibacteria group bacterium]
MNKHLSDLKDKKIEGKTFLVRLDTNVPLKDGEVANDLRLKTAVPTLRFLMEKGARVIAVGHMEPAEESSLRVVADYYRDMFTVSFEDSCDPEEVSDKVKELRNGEMLILENLRSLPYEKGNDDDFARRLASLADIFVNEAFPVSHREHASVVGLPRYLPSFIGMRFEREIKELSFAFSPERPFVFALGGLKFKTKAPLIKKFTEKADEVFVGGALANAFFEQKGMEIGLSAVDEGVDLKELFGKENISLPEDVVVKNEEGESRTVDAESVSSTESIVDVGPRSIEKVSEKIKQASLVIWNGPMGNTEGGFEEQTFTLARSIADSKAYSIIGGGDTVASIEGLGLEDEFSFISTGGGAMLEFLVNENLPGIEAVKNSPELSF